MANKKISKTHITKNTTNNHLPDSSKYYQYSSEAYELVPEELDNKESLNPVQPPHPKKKKKTNNNRIKRKRKGPLYIKKINPDRRLSMSTYFTAGILFICIILYMFTFAMIAVGEYNIEQMDKSLKLAKEDNAAALSALYEEQYDWNEIESIAKTQLGMVKPADHQIIPIVVERQNFFVLYDNEDEITYKSIIENIFNKSKK